MCLWAGIVVTIGAGTAISLFLWKDIEKPAITWETLVKFPVFTGLATLVVLLHRATIPAERERRDYEKQGNIIASSIAAHKEALSVSLRRVIAEALEWKSVPVGLSVHVDDENNIYVENLLPEAANVGGYEVICRDKNNRRMAGLNHQFPAGEMLGEHTYKRVLADETTTDVVRVELRDKERNIVSEWSDSPHRPA